MAGTSCIFCGDSKSTMTREHLWPQWVTKYFKEQHGLKGKFPWESFNYKRGYSSRPVTGMDESVRVVCKTRCNSGWLNDLENEAKPIVIPLILGTPSALSKAQQRILIAWVTRFAMVGEFCGVGRQVFTPDEREDFMSHLKPPHDVDVWLSAYSGWRLSYHCEHFLSRTALEVTRTTSRPSRYDDDKIMNITTGSLGRLVFQLRVSRWRGTNRTDPPGYATERFKAATVRLWPSRRLSLRSLRWPPRYYLRTRDLYAFCDRWGTSGMRHLHNPNDNE